MNGAVYIVDDDEGIRDELGDLLKTSGFHIRVFPSGEALLKESRGLTSGCVILDLNLPGMNGLEVQKKLLEEGADHQIIMLTGQADVPTAVQVIQAGASNYLLKPFSVRTLQAALEAAFGRLEEESEAQQNRSLARAAINRLSPRETDVLRELLKGAPNKIIAFKLGLSTRTVEMYRGSLMDKLEVRSLPEAMRLAIVAGFISATAQSAG